MKRFVVVNALYGLNKQVPAAEMEDLKQRLENVDDLPELQIIHNAYMRDKVANIEKYVKTIKTIVVLLFAATVLGALIMMLN